MTLGAGASAVRALKGVSIEIPRGQVTLLTGPSGSGKTTLLSILGCILTPQGGRVQVGGLETTGLDVEGLAAIRRHHIGFVFQSYNLFPTLTALQNVRLALAVRKINGSPAGNAASALEAVGLGHKLDAYPRHLSGGEQQRVAIARAIVGDPAVILADEPTAALDSENGQGIIKLLSGLAKNQRRAVLVVTHDNRIEEFADRIIRMEDGLIAATPALQTTPHPYWKEAFAHA